VTPLNLFPALQFPPLATKYSTIMDDVWINYKWMTVTIEVTVIQLLMVIRIANYFPTFTKLALPGLPNSRDHPAQQPCLPILSLDHERDFEPFYFLNSN
jgi:hypothetical protein